MTEQVNQQEQEPKKDLLILDPFQHQEAELKKLAADYTNMVVTEENLKAAEDARLKLWRIRVKEISKNLKERLEKIKEFKTDQETKAEKLCKIIQPVEEDLEKKIATVKMAKEKREREEREKEQARIAAHRNKIAELNKLVIRINSMEMEELNSFDIKDYQTYNAEEFAMEFLQAKAAVLSAKTSRKELLTLRQQEAERKAQEEAAQKARAEKEMEANDANERFKQLTNMLSEVNLTEDLNKVEQFLEISENTQPIAYRDNAPQAEGILAALKMLATTRKEFLLKKAADAVTMIPKVVKEETVIEYPDPPKQAIEEIPPMIFEGPQSESSIAIENHVPDMFEPKEEPNVIHGQGIGKPAFEESDFNVFQYETYKVALSKNVPEKAAKSILNYCEHMLKTK